MTYQQNITKLTKQNKTKKQSEDKKAIGRTGLRYDNNIRIVKQII